MCYLVEKKFEDMLNRLNTIHECDGRAVKSSGTLLAWLQSKLEGRIQFVKQGLYQSPVLKLQVGVPQGSVLGPLLFAVYCSPVAG